MYIVLEGMDCTGKTTLAKELVKLFKQEGYDVIHLHEPYKNNNDLKAIRELITDSKLSDDAKGLLALSSRIELFKRRIEPSLDNDIVVISERNFVSTLVYQGGDNPEPLLKMHQTAFDAFNADMYPDVLIHLQNTHEEYLARVNNRGQTLDGIERALLSKGYFDGLKGNYRNAIKLATKKTKTKVINANSTQVAEIFAELLNQK